VSTSLRDSPVVGKVRLSRIMSVSIVSVVNSESLGFQVIGHQQPIRSSRSEEFSKLTADLISNRSTSIDFPPAPHLVYSDLGT
jgi:hypothetical protein